MYCRHAILVKHIVLHIPNPQIQGQVPEGF